MKLTPPPQKDKRSFLMSGRFSDEGPLHLAVKAGETEDQGGEALLPHLTVSQI